MADPNLDLGLDYTGGITKPTSDQAGYVTRVTADGLNVEYVPADQILVPVNSLVFATSQERIDAVTVGPGWTAIGGFFLPSALSFSLEVIGAVSDPSLVMTTRIYCVTAGAVGPIPDSYVVIGSSTDVRVLSSVFTLPGSRLYQVQAQVVGAAGTNYFGTVRRTSPSSAAPVVETGNVAAIASVTLSALTASGVVAVSTTGAVFLPGYPEFFGWTRTDFQAGRTRKQFVAGF